MSNPSGTRDTMRLFCAVVAWGALFWALSRHGVDLLPRAWAHELTLEAYLAIVQLITALGGLLLSSMLLSAPCRELALVTPSGVSTFRAVALSPLVFVAATGAAFQLARPTLLEELARGGAALVQKSTGEFGREVVAAPLWMALAWGALVSPLAEELFFRGALFSLVARLTRKNDTNESRAADLSPELLDDAAAMRAARTVVEWLRDGGAAALLVAIAFGVLHRDMPGGMGIVRFVSALGLGVAAGVARQRTGSVVPAMLLHVVFNTLSIAAARRLIVSDVFPVKSAVPTLAVLMAAVGLVAVLAERFLVPRRG